MPIKVDWIDRNITVDSFRLYRSTTPVPDSPLPAPLATIPAGTFTYTDLTTVRNKTYYYRVGTVVGAEETLSSNVALAHMPYTGPGPQKLLRGDWACGYFGQVSQYDLFTPVEILTLTNSGMGAYTSSCVWNKHVYQGKILYFPEQVLSVGYAWNTIYAKGLVYGNTPVADWPAYVKTNYGTVAQGVVISRGDHSFVVRTPQMRASLTLTDLVGPLAYGGEYDNCLALVYQARSLPPTIPQLPQFALDDQTFNGTNYTMMADQYSGASGVWRSNPVDGVATQTYSATGATYGWRPVLELVF